MKIGNLLPVFLMVQLLIKGDVRFGCERTRCRLHLVRR